MSCKILFFVAIFVSFCSAQFNLTSCNGVNGQTSGFLSPCGICCGGDTEVPCSSFLDCAGTCNGQRTLDVCGNCVDVCPKAGTQQPPCEESCANQASAAVIEISDCQDDIAGCLNGGSDPSVCNDQFLQCVEDVFGQFGYELPQNLTSNKRAVTVEVVIIVSNLNALCLERCEGTVERDCKGVCGGSANRRECAKDCKKDFVGFKTIGLCLAYCAFNGGTGCPNNPDPSHEGCETLGEIFAEKAGAGADDPDQLCFDTNGNGIRDAFE